MTHQAVAQVQQAGGSRSDFTKICRSKQLYSLSHSAVYKTIKKGLPMIFRVRVIALTLISSLVLVACGGGGGGTSPTAAAPAAVAITESSAKPVTASALGAAQGTSATDGAGLLVGVEVQGGSGASPATLKAMAETARFASSSLAGRGGSLVTGVTSSESVDCPVSGKLTISGSVSGAEGAVAGDTVTFTANNCVMDVDGETGTMNGSLSFTVISGSVTSTLPMNVVFSMVATNFSIAGGGTSVTVNGDVRMDLTITSTSETIVTSGSSFSIAVTESGTTYTDSLKNYSQTFVYNGSTVTGSLSATVESSSTVLGSGGGSYTITTTTPLVWNESTGTLSSGVIKVVGANGSQLVMTVTSSTTVTIQVDANGDGTFESTVTSTQTELRNLL